MCSAENRGPIITNQFFRDIKSIKNFPWAITATIAFGIIVLELSSAPPCLAQPKTPQSAPLHFEVDSVKPVDQGHFETKPHRSGGRITWTTDLRQLVEYAYNIQNWKLSGRPLQSHSIFAVEALTDSGTTQQQVRIMFQSLLAERFKLKSHREMKFVDGYALTVASSGPKIKEVEPSGAPHSETNDPDGSIVATLPTVGKTAITGRNVSILQLVLALNVIDRTNLQGKYSFTLLFASLDAPPDTDAPSLFTAIQKLGLRLVRQKTSVEMLIIDNLESDPTKN